MRTTKFIFLSRLAIVFFSLDIKHVSISNGSWNLVYCFQLKVSSDTHQELTCTNLTNYYYEGVNGDEFDPRDNATLEDFRTCNRTDPEFWNTTILQKEITGKYIYILLILNPPILDLGWLFIFLGAIHIWSQRPRGEGS